MSSFQKMKGGFKYQVSDKVNHKILESKPIGEIVNQIKKESRENGLKLKSSQAHNVLKEIIFQGLQKGGNRVSLPLKYFDDSSTMPMISSGGKKNKNKKSTRKSKSKHNNKHKHNNKPNNKHRDNKNKNSRKNQRGGTFGAVSDNSIDFGGGSNMDHGSHKHGHIGTETVDPTELPGDLASTHAADQGTSRFASAMNPPSIMQQTMDYLTGKDPLFTPSRSNHTTTELQTSDMNKENVSLESSKPLGIHELPVDPIIEGGQVIKSTLGSSLTLEKQVNVLNDVKSKHVEPTGNRFSGAELKISGEKVDQSGGARKQQKNKQTRRQQNNKNRKKRTHRGGFASSDWRSTLYSRGPINTPQTGNTTSPFSDTPHLTKDQMLSDLGITKIQQEAVPEVIAKNGSMGLSSKNFS